MSVAPFIFVKRLFADDERRAGVQNVFDEAMAVSMFAAKSDKSLTGFCLAAVDADADRQLPIRTAQFNVRPRCNLTQFHRICSPFLRAHSSTVPRSLYGCLTPLISR